MLWEIIAYDLPAAKSAKSTVSPKMPSSAHLLVADGVYARPGITIFSPALLSSSESPPASKSSAEALPPTTSVTLCSVSHTIP